VTDRNEERGAGMAQMSAANINDLPDSAFAYIEPGGSKDADGKTTPRSKRHFPIHDEAHVRNALSRAPQSPFGDKAMPKILAAAKKYGIKTSQRAALPAGMEQRIYPAQFEVRSAPDGTGGTKYSLSGYATVYDRPYPMFDQHGEYVEQVRAGAGKKTLSENPDVVLVLNHDGMPMARTKNGSLKLSEDSTGLHTDAPALNGERQIVREVVAAVDEAILDEMSFRFHTTRQAWNDDYTQRDISEYNLHRGDVSVVTFGANPNTAVAMRAQDFDLMDEDAARALYERLGRRLTPTPETQQGRSLALLYADLDALDLSIRV
jgi:HK97 family phage prohead protease